MANQLLKHRYEIVKLLGNGGFTQVYLARDRDLPGQPFWVMKHLKPQFAVPELLLKARRLFEINEWIWRDQI